MWPRSLQPTGKRQPNCASTSTYPVLPALRDMLVLKGKTPAAAQTAHTLPSDAGRPQSLLTRCSIQGMPLLTGKQAGEVGLSASRGSCTWSARPAQRVTAGVSAGASSAAAQHGKKAVAADTASRPSHRSACIQACTLWRGRNTRGPALQSLTHSAGVLIQRLDALREGDKPPRLRIDHSTAIRKGFHCLHEPPVSCQLLSMLLRVAAAQVEAPNVVGQALCEGRERDKICPCLLQQPEIAAGHTKRGDVCKADHKERVRTEMRSAPVSSSRPRLLWGRCRQSL